VSFILLFLFSLIFFPLLFILDAFGFNEEAYEIAKYLVAFFLGMLVWELVL